MTLTLPWSRTINTKPRPEVRDGVQLRDSERIEVDGVFVGVAVTHQLGVRFIATNDRLGDMDQSIWPTLGYARQAARHLLASKSLTNSF
jgi:hypothetical protein